MRAAIALLLLLIAAPAWAQYWTPYANARFGYELDVPPDFVGNGESANGDGQIFYNLAAEQGLTVWGGHVLEGFEKDAKAVLDAASAENWSITAQSLTPHWAAFSGQRDHRIVQYRMILLCDAVSYAAYRLEYNIRDVAQMAQVIDGINRSFRGKSC